MTYPTISNWRPWARLMDRCLHTDDGVRFDFITMEYVDGEGGVLDFDTVEDLGWDGTLRNVRVPAYLRGHIRIDERGKLSQVCGFEQVQLVNMCERDALRDALFSSYAFEDLEQDEYTAINERVYTVLGERRAERLAIICTNELWSSEDMMHCAFDIDRMNELLARLDEED